MRINLTELYQLFLSHPVVSTDTRTISTGCLFFAIKGETFDGNSFASEAIAKGAAFSIIDDPAAESDKTILVPDVLTTIQQLASLHRSMLEIPVVAITGTNGKTTTKELMNAVLGSTYKVKATAGNLNNHIGVPLTLLSINSDTQIAIIEMGANHQGEIEFLCNLARPTHGLITNIGKAHLEGFGGYEGVIRTKSELYHFLRSVNGTALVNGNNRLLGELSEGMNRIFYGENEGFRTTGKPLQSAPYLDVSWFKNGENRIIQTQLVGAYNFENVMAAICAGVTFDVPDENIASSIAGYQPSNNRSQSLKTAYNLLILDAYNANPSSMQAALQNFGTIKAEKKMVILGDMLELGNEGAAEHTAILETISKMNLDKVILVGPEFLAVSESKFLSFEDSSSAAEWLKQHPVKDFTILVKGSRGTKMEVVLDAL